MKGTFLVATCSVLATPASAFVPFAPGTSLSRRVPMTAQLAVAVEAPTITQVATPVSSQLPKGKRIVRRKKARPPSSPVEVDITNAPVQRIASGSDYLHALKSNENKLVVMKFFTPYCRSCKAMDVKYRRLAVENPDVAFYEVDIVASPELKRDLGIQAVPTVKLNAGSLGQVASLTCGPRKVPILAHKIELCKDVAALSARVSKNPGMFEMVEDEMGSKRRSSPSTSGEQDLKTEPIGIVKGLMEKLARQEELSRALTEETRTAVPIDDSVDDDITHL